MIDKEIRDVIFIDIHKAIEESAKSVLSPMQNQSLSYPPGNELTKEEMSALSNLKLSDAAKSGIKKLLMDACAYPLFHFFSLLDAVTDPESDIGDTWLGATIDSKSTEDEPMLHDEFYESYWLYQKK